MQWCCNRTSNIFFQYYQFLFSEDDFEYYSYGNINKTTERENKKKKLTSLEPNEELELKPYLYTILKFYHLKNDDEKDILSIPKENIFSNEENVGICKNNSSKFFSEEPFNSIFTELDDVNKEQKTFAFHKQEILKILSSSLSEFKDDGTFIKPTKMKRKIDYHPAASEKIFFTIEFDNNENDKDSSNLEEKRSIITNKNIFLKQKRKAIHRTEKNNRHFRMNSIDDLKTSRTERASSERIIKSTMTSEFIYDSISESESELIILGNDDDMHSCDCEHSDRISPTNYLLENYSHKKKENIIDPSLQISIFDCLHIFEKTPKNSHVSLQNLQNSYFGQMFELIYGGFGAYYHKPNETESYKARILDSLLLYSWEETMEKQLIKILTEVFSASKMEIQETVGCFYKWLGSEEITLPYSSYLKNGTYQYWKKVENDSNGWELLAKVSILFCNTASSESDVEREISKDQFRLVDRKWMMSSEYIDMDSMI
jgi:hypothetical protein